MSNMQPYRIQQPIGNLRQLKAEKRKLKTHIKTADHALRHRVQRLPAVAMLRGLQHFGSKIIHSKAGSYAADFFATSGSGKALPAILKSVAIFAGMQIAKYFFNKQEGMQHHEDWMSMFADEDEEEDKEETS